MATKLTTHEHSYYSADTMEFKSDTAEVYPVEYLNKITPEGLPSHRLTLKIDMPVILLRNLDPKNGLCNGTRMVVTGLFNYHITARIVTPGVFFGKDVKIPRIKINSKEGLLPFILGRRQLPIRTCYAMTINR
jgi:ATP-dependent DNA helicase PIF1